MNSKNIIIGIVSSFFGALTFGNAPYAITGYGLSTFFLLIIAFCFAPEDAYISFIIGNTLGLALDLYTGSMFMLVIVGAGVFRIVQAIVVIEMRKRTGLVVSAMTSIIALTIIATLIGMAFYGGEGLMTAMTILDVFYIAPAYLVYYVQQSSISDEHKLVGYVLTISSTVVVFLSASTFILPIPLVVGLVFLIVFAYLSTSQKLSGITLKSAHSYGVSIGIIVIFVVTFLLSLPTAQYAVGTVLYPLEPNSLTGSQWTQTNTNNPICKNYNKNTAGKGTEENGVWSPERLRVMNTCQTVTGTIIQIQNVTGTNVDNDFTFDIKPDAGYTHLLSFGSYAIQGGTLHIEVVPSDQATVLQGLSLKVGDHVSVTGVWLLDTNHGWYSEIHPAMNITVL